MTPDQRAELYRQECGEQRIRILRLESALKSIIKMAQDQGAFTGVSWKDVETFAESALADDDSN